MDTCEPSKAQSAGKAESERLITKDFLILNLSGLCFLLSSHMVNPVIPLYLTQMGGTQGQVGMILSVRSFVALITRPLGGALVDRGLLRPLLAFSGLASVASSVSYIFVPAVSLAGLVEGIKGLGITAYTTASSTAVADLAPARRRGEAVGIYSILQPMALALGPVIGLALLAQLGFANLFALSALVGLVSVVLVNRIRLPRVERETSAPLKLVSREALLPSGALLCTCFAQGAIWAFIPIYALQSGLGDPGPFFAVLAISMFLIRLVCGRLSDTYGRVVVFVPGALSVALSNLYLSTGPGYLGFLIAGVLLGCGLGVAHPAMVTLAIDRARLEERGSAMSTVWAAVDAGITLGTLADGFILERGGFGAMFGANAVMPIVGVIGFLVLDHRSRRRQALVSK